MQPVHTHLCSHSLSCQLITMQPVHTHLCNHSLSCQLLTMQPVHTHLCSHFLSFSFESAAILAIFIFSVMTIFHLQKSNIFKAVTHSCYLLQVKVHEYIYIMYIHMYYVYTYVLCTYIVLCIYIYVLCTYICIMHIHMCIFAKCSNAKFSIQLTP